MTTHANPCGGATTWGGFVEHLIYDMLQILSIINQKLESISLSLAAQVSEMCTDHITVAKVMTLRKTLMFSE